MDEVIAGIKLEKDRAIKRRRILAER